MPDQGDGRRQQAARPPARPLRDGPPGRRRRARSASRSPSSAAASCTSRRWDRPRPTSSARPACPRCPTRTGIAACRSRTSSPRSGGASCRSATRCASCRRTSWPRSGPTRSRTRSSRSTRSPRSSTSTPGSSRPTGRAATAPSRSRRTRSAPPTRPRRWSRCAPRSRWPGAPDESPIPLADTAAASAAAIGAGATKAKSAAGNGFERAIWRIQDMLPRRKSTPSKKVTAGTASRMETQRRAAVALLAFVVVAGALVFGVYAVGGQRQPLDAIPSLTAAKTRVRGRPGGAGQRERAGRRPDHRRPPPGPRAAERRLPAARRRRGGGLPARADRAAARRRRSRASTGCTAS